MPTSYKTIGLAATIVLMTAATVPAQAPAGAVLDPRHLAVDPNGDGVAPAAVFQPEPPALERWRDGLAAIEARYDADLAGLRASASGASGLARMQAERRLQVRKLDFEIEVIELQLSLLPLASPPDAAPAGASIDVDSAVEELRESAARLRDLREQIDAGGPAVMPSDQTHAEKE